MQLQGRLSCRSSHYMELKCGHCSDSWALGTITEHKTQINIHSRTRDTNEQYSHHDYNTAQTQLLSSTFSCLIFYRLHKQQEIIDNVSTWVKIMQTHGNYGEIPYVTNISSRTRHTHKTSPTQGQTKILLNGLKFMKWCKETVILFRCHL